MSNSNYEESYQHNTLAQLIRSNSFARRDIYIWEEIDTDVALVVNRAIEKFRENDAKREEKLPINFRINSPGGEIFSCLSIISAIESCQKDGYSIHTYTYGMAASAALFVHLCGSKKQRYCQKYSRFLLHEPQQLSIGFSSLENQKRQYLDTQDIWTSIRGIIKSHTKVTDEFLDEVSKNDKDYYFWPDEAKKLGVVDNIF